MRLRVILSLIFSLISVHSCSGGSVVGSGNTERKEPKKKAAEAPAESDPADGKASEPQVVTGSYLSCEYVNSPQDITLWETNIGCALMQKSTNKKVEIANLSRLSLTAFNASGTPVSFKVLDATHPKYHKNLIVSRSDSCGLKVYSELVSETGSIEKYSSGVGSCGSEPKRSVKLCIDVGLFKIGTCNGSDSRSPKEFDRSYTFEEKKHWCTNELGARSFPLFPSPKDVIDFGTACGVEYIDSKSLTSALVPNLSLIMAELLPEGGCPKIGYAKICK
jgi:hypothetical protein